MNTQISVGLVNVSKKYILHHEKPTLMESILKRKSEAFYALKNVNLEIKKGEKVGIIGPNGSGKTTLLKIITGISTPTSGKVQTNGKIVSLIDFEAGFHPDLTGIQNIFLNGMILGMSKKEISENIPGIIEFADIGQFIDAPLFTYSEGMKLRLGFSIAVSSNPDTLVLDEGISSGDENFRKKAMERIQQMFREKRTILIASHWLEFIKDNCTRLLILEKGKQIHFGSTKPLDRILRKR